MPCQDLHSTASVGLDAFVLYSFDNKHLLIKPIVIKQLSVCACVFKKKIEVF